MGVELGVPYPEYPIKHSGVAIVAGDSQELMDDFNRAKEMFPEAQVMAINQSAKWVKAQFLFTIHTEKMAWWKDWQRDFQDNLNFTIHAPGSISSNKQEKRETAYPYVDYWWTACASEATSAWAGMKVLRSMGFDKVILCGCPLSQVGKYYDGGLANDFNQTRMIEHYRNGLLEDKLWHANVFSMSGYTREVLGEPS